jgi:phosphatidate cytidylyltransferase
VTEQQAKPKSDLGVRTASAVVMAAVAGASLWHGGWLYTLFISAVTIGLLWEWWGLSDKIASHRLAKLSWMIGGLIYIGLAAFLLFSLGSDAMLGGEKMATNWVVPLVLVVIATDVGAYFAGRSVGGPKIAPKISPSKTWSGLLGGMFAAAVTLYLWNEVAQPNSNDGTFWLLLSGAVLAIVAQTGDFFESWMKRKAGVKDSSKLIPGHGGLLDRVDGLLPVVIVASGVAFSIIVLSGDL